MTDESLDLDELLRLCEAAPPTDDFYSDDLYQAFRQHGPALIERVRTVEGELVECRRNRIGDSEKLGKFMCDADTHRVELAAMTGDRDRLARELEQAKAERDKWRREASRYYYSAD